MLAHLRTIVPGDALVAGLNAARAEVTALRAERKKRKAVQVRQSLLVFLKLLLSPHLGVVSSGGCSERGDDRAAGRTQEA